ncbi:hypothetical protein QBC35DRAFT_536746, partial [Podospora australis]
MLLCRIINELERAIVADGHCRNLAYFFCQATDLRINNSINVLRGLIYLLAHQQPRLISHIRKYMDADKSLSDANAWFALSDILGGMLGDPKLKPTYLVIDALDECMYDLPRLLKFIVGMSSTFPRVKWIVSSRNWPNIEENLEAAEKKIRLSLELNEESISSASRNGSIIITTRNRYLADRLTGRPQNIIEVGPMTQTDSITLLKNKLGSLSDMTVATNLVQALDLVPLAISQAAAYIRIRAPRSSPEKYLAEFQKGEGQKIRLLQYDGGDLRRDGGASNTIFTTWQISFDHIRSKRPSAAKLLSLMSFFDRQGIPERVLKDATRARSLNMAGDGKFGDGGGKPNDRSAIGGDTNINADDVIEECFEDDVAMLREYCLVTTNADGDEFEMHGLVQLSTRIWLKAYEQQETFKQQYIKQMAESFPPGEYQNWGKCQGLFAHVQVALDYRPDENTAERWATLLHNGGWYARTQGRYDVAEQMAAKARGVREKKLGKRDLMTLASTALFGLILKDRGRWEEAEKLFVQVMETRKTKLGADHPDTLTSMANLASTYRNQGRWEEAEKLEVQVMETSKTKLGADHPDTLTSMANLASTYRNQGRWEEAEKLEVQ